MHLLTDSPISGGLQLAENDLFDERERLVVLVDSIVERATTARTVTSTDALVNVTRGNRKNNDCASYDTSSRPGRMVTVHFAQHMPGPLLVVCPRGFFYWRRAVSQKAFLLLAHFVLIAQ